MTILIVTHTTINASIILQKIPKNIRKVKVLFENSLLNFCADSLQKIFKFLGNFRLKKGEKGWTKLEISVTL